VSAQPLDVIGEFDSRPVPLELLRRFTTYMAEGNRFDMSAIGRAFDEQDLCYSASFGYSPDQMASDLRLDLRPRSHNRLAYLNAVNVVEQQNSGRQKVDIVEEGVALLSQRIHDIGEVVDPLVKSLAGGSVGDIPYGEKTAEDRLTESRVRQVLYDMFFSDYPAWLIERLEAVISHDDRESVAHDIAECGHMILTYNTGLSAVRLVLNEREEAAETSLYISRPIEETERLSSLGVTVTRRMHSKLQPFVDKGYVAAQRTIKATEKLYQRGQTEIDTPEAA